MAEEDVGDLARAAAADPAPVPALDTLAGTPQHIRDLLARLHKQSAAQHEELDMKVFNSTPFADFMRDKFIALDEDKCDYVYTLLRATGATTIVEAGTSYGVSTIYLALAAAANAAAAGTTARVIATEHEPAKAAQARAYWAECGPAVTDAIELREGDLRETLKTDLGTVDLLLLDSELLSLSLSLLFLTHRPPVWTPMALPTLKVVLPALRRGAIVLTDNTTSAAKPYRELLTFLRDPANGFVNVTMPYGGGFEMSVYQPAN